MEYKSEEESGYSAWYKLEGDRNIPVKVSKRKWVDFCNYSFITRNFRHNESRMFTNLHFIHT